MAEFEQRIYGLVMFMAVSARNLIDEPQRYGPARLLDAIGRLISILDSTHMSSPRLDELRNIIEEQMVDRLCESDEAYLDFLDTVVQYLLDRMD